MRHTSLLCTLVACIALLSACGKPTTEEQLLPEVFVIGVEEQPYYPQRGFNARIESKSDVDIRAEVSGKLIAIHFTEGDQVEAGAPLFDIDPAPYKAALAQAQAQLSKAKAKLANDKKNFERGKKLVEDGFISASEFDTLEARELESMAAVEAAEASVESAKVNLDYTSIVAPQAGRVGRAHSAIGDVVSPNTEALTTLVGQNDMQVVFQLPEKTLLAVQRDDAAVKLEDIEVAVIMPDGSEYPHVGKIDYFSNRVDPKTGTLEARAAINNDDDILRPGLFVQALIRVKEPLMGVMIPQAAVQVDQVGTYVLAIAEDDTVKRINMVTGERFGEKVLINSGLDVGERIIMRGVQQARPGTKVKVSDYKPATEAAQ